MKDPKQWLDEQLAKLVVDPAHASQAPDCYVVYKTSGTGVVGLPVAIFRSRAALYAKFAALVESVDPKWGIGAAVWWFDDEETP